MAIIVMKPIAFQSSLPIRWAILGVVLFVIPEPFIAINQFVYLFVFESYIIMSGYYVAQIILEISSLQPVKQD